MVSASAFAQACRTHQELRLDLNRDRVDELMVWRRCSPSEVGPEGEGGIAHPLDTVFVRRAGNEEIVYSNAEFPEAEEMSTLEKVNIGGETQALVVWRGYGTGNVHGWKLVDLRDGQVRSWKRPELRQVLATKLSAGETLGKQEGAGVKPVDGGLVEGHYIYRAGERNCCPSGGVVRAQLEGKDGALTVVRVWREPMP
jgi:hypothetical protein